MEVTVRIARLRVQMKEKGLDAYIIPSSDPHQSEYVANHWKTREWISGFTGSAGTVVVTMDHVGLWTDSRYFLQAEQQLEGTGIVLHKLQVQGMPEHIEWLVEELAEGSHVGCDGWLFSVDQVRQLEKHFYPYDIHLHHDADIITPIWTGRPILPQHPLFELSVAYAGLSRAEKLALIRGRMSSQGADLHLVSTLDDIAWIFNIRSNDVECNPVSIAYSVIGLDHAYLFIDEAKVPEAERHALHHDGVLLKPYEGISKFLSETSDSHRILVDPGTTSIQLYTAIGTSHLIHGPTISSAIKASKNETEIRNLRKAMVKDGVALTLLFRWLEATLAERTVSEVEVAGQLDGFRRAQGGYHGESFEAIVGYESNGAIIHYRAEPGTCAQIRPEGILLLDSGGQYTCGTTDITRTVALGTPTEEQRRNFTLVLKGHIALAMLKFPYGTKGVQMDILARQFLWQQGLNYSHGTGHGVGFFLNVHEPPQGFITGLGSRGVTVMEPGMLTSNEPGFYKTGAYGIRIENLVLAVPDETTDYGQFLRFDTVTLFPIDLQLVDGSLLSKAERRWLNAYHDEVFAHVGPELGEADRKWLKEKCAHVSK